MWLHDVVGSVGAPRSQEKAESPPLDSAVARPAPTTQAPVVVTPAHCAMVAPATTRRSRNQKLRTGRRRRQHVKAAHRR